VRSNKSLTEPSDEPKDARTTDACRGFLESSRGVGRSFCACIIVSWCTSAHVRQLYNRALTICTLALPSSLTLNGKGASRPESSSLSMMKAWCGLLPLPLSFVVRLIFAVSACPRVTGFGRALLGFNLGKRKFTVSDACSLQSGQTSSLLWRALCVLLRHNANASIVEGPG
jgi:hypothetical protein